MMVISMCKCGARLKLELVVKLADLKTAFLCKTAGNN